MLDRGKVIANEKLFLPWMSHPLVWKLSGNERIEEACKVEKNMLLIEVG
jgi:hypothetical protein